MTRSQESQKKLASLRVHLHSCGADGALVNQQSNFSYLTSGGRGFLGLSSVQACAMLLVTSDAAYLLANDIEGPRLVEEELPHGVFIPRFIPWTQDNELTELARTLCPGRIMTDGELAGYFQGARMILCPEEADRYRALGRESAHALEQALRDCTPGESEYQIAGRVSAGLWSIGGEPISLFIGADARSERVRHYVPTANRATRQVIASICVRRNGLVISCTRTVVFGHLDSAQTQGYARLLQVEAAMLDALLPGAPMSASYVAACAAYEAQGLPGEYLNHHQGGATAYLPREIRFDENTATPIALGQAFAFNPSCRGAKVEDTVLLTAEGIEILSQSGQWPMADVRGRSRPCILTL